MGLQIFVLMYFSELDLISGCLPGFWRELTGVSSRKVGEPLVV
jgi:hypothetical protein